MIYYVFPIISAYFFSSSLNYIKDNIKERYPLKNVYLGLLSIPFFIFFPLHFTLYDVYFSLSCFLSEFFLLLNLRKISQSMTFFFISLKSLVLVVFDLYNHSLENLAILFPLLVSIMIFNRKHISIFLIFSFFFDALSLILCQKMKGDSLSIQANKNILLACISIPFLKRIYVHHQYFYSFLSSTIYFYPLKFVVLSLYSLTSLYQDHSNPSDESPHKACKIYAIYPHYSLLQSHSHVHQ